MIHSWRFIRLYIESFSRWGSVSQSIQSFTLAPRLHYMAGRAFSNTLASRLEYPPRKNGRRESLSASLCSMIAVNSTAFVAKLNTSSKADTETFVNVDAIKIMEIEISGASSERTQELYLSPVQHGTWLTIVIPTYYHSVLPLMVRLPKSFGCMTKRPCKTSRSM